MKQKTQTLLVASALLVIAGLILLLSVITALRGQIHLTARGNGHGWDVSLADDGAWFYVVPGVQAIIGLACLIGAIQMFAELRS